MLDWERYIELASRFERKAKAQDREDLRHNIILALARQQARNEAHGKPELTFYGMLRIASHCVADYWRELKRNARIISLNTVIADDDGDSIELIDTIADDKAIDLDAWLDRRTFLLGCPNRLIQIAHKIQQGKALTGYERLYLYRFRKREQKRLL
jgi:hypothetical protein